MPLEELYSFQMVGILKINDLLQCYTKFQFFKKNNYLLPAESSRDGTVPQVITSSPLIQVQTCETTNTIPVLGAPKPVTSVISTSLEARLPSLRETVIHIETAAPKMRPEVSVHRSAMSEARHRQTQQVPTTQIIHCDIQHSNNGEGLPEVILKSLQSLCICILHAVEDNKCLFINK